jgi:hypothetical protein
MFIRNKCRLLYTIRSKNDLVNAILQSERVRPAIKRAIEEGRCENLGGFMFPGETGSWCLKVSGISQTWYLKIHVSICGDLKIGELRWQPDWKYWEGDKSVNPLYTGDRPYEYRELKRTESDK